MEWSSKIAYLVYSPLLVSIDRQTKGGSKFENKGMRGLMYVIHEIESKTKTKIMPCSVDSAYKFDFVLVSLTSSYDVVNFCANTQHNKDWLNRKFKVICGGSGAINVYPLLDIVDFVFFGRSENLIGEIALNNFEYEHESYLKIKDGIRSKKIRQPNHLIEIGNIKQGNSCAFYFKERFTGCKSKCYYCHYSFTRELNGEDTYLIDNPDIGNFIELEQLKIKYFNPSVAMYVCAIDGNTQKVRDIYNRKLTDRAIQEFFEHASNNTKCKGLVFKLYSILGMEGENYGDSDKLINQLGGIKNLDKKINIKMKFTPFRPSPLTPSQYSKIDLFNIAKYYPCNQKIGGEFTTYLDSEKVKIFSMSAAEGFIKYLSDLSVVRCSENTIGFFKNVILNRKLHSLKNSEAMFFVKNKYDLTDIIREYDIAENTPTWYLESYISNEKIKKMRLQMKRKINNALT